MKYLVKALVMAMLAAMNYKQAIQAYRKDYLFNSGLSAALFLMFAICAAETYIYG